jgi:hypothetical protein
LYFASNMPPKGFQHHHTFWPKSYFFTSVLFGKINMKNCHFKFKWTRAYLLSSFFHAISPKSTEVKKIDFCRNVWWCWKPFGGILLAKYKSNRPSFFRRKFCMVLSYSFSNMPLSFLLQSQKKTTIMYILAVSLEFFWCKKKSIFG